MREILDEKTGKPISREECVERYLSDPQHVRSFNLGIAGREAIQEEARTVSVAFSSEEPYLRWFGYEVLDHNSGSVRLGRLQDGGAVLMDHDTRDLVGVIESVTIDSDRVGRATLRFGRSARAQEIFTDVVDGIRKSISVGYRVHRMVLESEKSGEEPVYRVNDWEPFEVSLVSVPADATVGVGRNHSSIRSEIIMETVIPVVAPVPAVHIPVDVTAEKNAARSDELTRMRGIEAVAKNFGYKDLGNESIDKGHSLAEFQQIVLAKMAVDKENVGDIPSLGLSQKEVKAYSIVRAMRALANPDSRSTREEAAYEFEVSEAAQTASGRRSFGFMVPPDIMQRDLTTVVGQGGYTIATSVEPLIDLLVNRSVIAQVGATVLTGLQGNVSFPRQITGAAGYWVAEGAAPTESQATFDQVLLSPKTYGAFSEYTRQLLMQSSLDVEALVRMDLARTLALGIDNAALYGTGATNQPRGVKNTVGINAPTAFVGAFPTFAEVILMETMVAEDNADVDALAYVLRPDMRGDFKTKLKAAGVSGFVWEDGNTVNGYKVGVSNQVVTGDLFYGNWNALMIAMWGGLDIMVNPYALDTSGGVRITALQSMDIGVRTPVSFAYNT